jgi:shikimate dehydrogenase
LPANIKKAAVIGYPVAHSLSPRLHNYWLKKYKIDGEYTAIEVLPENLADFIKSLDKNGFCGVNVTIPHKEAALNILRYDCSQASIDINAQYIGAINTIVVSDFGKLIGKNTDAYGFQKNIEYHFNKKESKKEKAVVLGAGGATNAIWNILIGMGFKEVVITNRTRKNIDTKEHIIKDMFAKVDGSYYTIHEWNDRNNILENADLLVNTTSLGMTGKDELDIDLSLLPKTAIVTDIVYNPLITPLLAQAQARGNQIVDALGMLLHQAVPAFEAWFGVRPVVDEDLRKYILDK